MRFIPLSMLLSGLLAVAAPAGAQERTGHGLLTRTVTLGQQAYDYQVYVPAKLQGQKKLPVILFLHGIGQRGEGGYVPDAGASGALARHYLERVPAIVLLPQCRKGQYWHSPEMERMVMAELDATVKEFGGDAKRVSLAGVSMGGFGAWHLASEQQGKFAAIVSICGGSPLTSGDRFAPIASRIGQTPVWVFHGEDDRVVPVTESRQMVKALNSIEGSHVRYSEYKGVGHNVWLKALAEKELLPWLLKQHLN
jgi:predicted peptidase